MKFESRSDIQIWSPYVATIVAGQITISIGEITIFSSLNHNFFCSDHHVSWLFLGNNNHFRLVKSSRNRRWKMAQPQPKKGSSGRLKAYDPVAERWEISGFQMVQPANIGVNHGFTWVNHELTMG